MGSCVVFLGWRDGDAVTDQKKVTVGKGDGYGWNCEPSELGNTHTRERKKREKKRACDEFVEREDDNRLSRWRGRKIRKKGRNKEGRKRVEKQKPNDGGGEEDDDDGDDGTKRVQK